MSDYTLPPALTLLAGMTGSGKTTYALRYLLNATVACRFIFDDLGRAATRLAKRPAYIADELENALADKWVVFNPHRMFPGDTKGAFRFFCRWVYDASRRGPGKKLFLADELWQWQTAFQIPPELALVAQTGREENLELVCATQLPHRLNASITGQATELVCFRLQERLALDCVEGLGADPDQISRLPLGSYVALNRMTGAKRAGRVF
jgi:hypothetical protein